MTEIGQDKTKLSQKLRLGDYSVSSDLTKLELRSHSFGNDVAILQNQLVALGYMKQSDIAGKGLGHYGPKTARAVESLKRDLNELPEQKKSPLKVNCIMDPTTREALNQSIEKYGFNGRNQEKLAYRGPAPEPTPAPAPTPAPSAKSAPEPTPAPEPKPAPNVKVAPEPTPARSAKSAPEPTPAPEPKPAPSVKSAPEPTPAPEPVAATRPLPAKPPSPAKPPDAA